AVNNVLNMPTPEVQHAPDCNLYALLDVRTTFARLEFRELCFSIQHDGADRFAFVHQVEGVVDFFQRHGVCDQVVDVDAALHVPVDDLRHIGAASRAAEGGALPDAAGDELERTRRDFLACAGDADDDRNAPTFVAALERLTHGLHIADAFE